MFKKRIGNLLIDMLLISLLLMALELIYPSAYVTQFKEINGELAQTGGYEKVSNREFIVSALGMAIFFCYYGLQEHFYGKTVGKFFTKTRVVGIGNSQLTFRTIVKRSLIRLIPFDIVSIFISDFVWHDKWSNTEVIEDKKS